MKSPTLMRSPTKLSHSPSAVVSLADFTSFTRAGSVSVCPVENPVHPGNKPSTQKPRATVVRFSNDPPRRVVYPEDEPLEPLVECDWEVPRANKRPVLDEDTGLWGIEI
ncbi:Protein of unknown function [Pyronema omphalodes CBS 100304]|uniref:Uncharacterized protein n=1 Tax=Pyronema omphalodes (strain CBS 100304) TaxID=1076935 RepID=U4L7T0_PYROM|nr:Protein of unknown function [Pyronema omphalodes CBS 100304]